MKVAATVLRCRRIASCLDSNSMGWDVHERNLSAIVDRSKGVSKSQYMFMYIPLCSYGTRIISGAGTY